MMRGKFLHEEWHHIKTDLPNVCVYSFLLMTDTQLGRVNLPPALYGYTAIDFKFSPRELSVRLEELPHTTLSNKYFLIYYFSHDHQSKGKKKSMRKFEKTTLFHFFYI